MDGLGRLRARPQVVQAVALSLVVLVFTMGWTRGELLLDGPGTRLYIQLALDQLRHGHWPAAWVPDMWAGTPAWLIGPPALFVPLAALAGFVGADASFRLLAVASQIVAALGAWALVRSVRGETPAAAVAGVAYGLSPVLISHAAFGHSNSIAVLAALPWFLRSLRLWLMEGAPRQLGLAAAFGAATVLPQAEHAYGVAVMTAAVVLIVALHRDGPGWRAVARRIAGVAGLVLGLLAHYLVPLYATRRQFVLTPPDLVRVELQRGLATQLGADPASFLRRATGFGRISFSIDFTRSGFFYLGLVAVALAVAAVPLLRRHDRQSFAGAMVLGAGLCLWSSTGRVSLAAGRLAGGRTVLAYALVSILAGLVLGTLVAQLARTPRQRRAALAGVAGFSAAFPYLRPFEVVRAYLPFLTYVRFPRLFPVAALGLAVAAALTVELAARRRAPRVATALVVVACAALVIDALPYRSIYFRHHPDKAPAYAAAVAGIPAGTRVAALDYGDPLATTSLLDAGRTPTMGWPHPMAGRYAWRVTGETVIWPSGLRDAALSLSATGAALRETWTGGAFDAGTLAGVAREDVAALPMVRVEEQTVSVRDDDGLLAAPLAARLASRHIGVVTGAAAPSALAAPASPCAAHSEPEGSQQAAVVAEVATACSLEPWLGEFDEVKYSDPAAEAGATFEATADRLQAITVWAATTGPRDNLVLEVHALAPDGRTVGPLVATGVPADPTPEQAEMIPFRFDQPISASAGKRYAWFLECATACPAGSRPVVAVFGADRAPGNLVLDGGLDPGHVAAFELDYADSLPAAPASPGAPAITSRQGDGTWSVSATLDKPALLVVADSWFPGWKATVDGHKAKVLVADGAFLGVALPAGRHRVELRYSEPPVVGYSLSISLSTAAVVGALVLTGHHRRRRRPRPRFLRRLGGRRRAGPRPSPSGG